MESEVRIIENTKAYEYEKITVTSTIGHCKPSVHGTANYALVTVESDATGVAIRYLSTVSTTVSSTDGLGMKDGATFSIIGAENINKFQVIQAQSGTHTIYIQYYK